MSDLKSNDKSFSERAGLTGITALPVVGTKTLNECRLNIYKYS